MRGGRVGALLTSTTESEPRPDITIYCLLCPSFHGATLFSLMLSNCNGILALGDTLPPRLRGFVCGCGKNLEECDFWKSVEGRLSYRGEQTLLPDLPTHVEAQDVDEPTWRQHPFPQEGGLARLVEGGERFLLLGSSLLAAKRGRKINHQRFVTPYCEFLRVCAEYYSFRVFIDGYKSKTRYAVMKAAGLPIGGVLHLTRDPRAYVASAKRVGVSARSAAREWTRYHTRTQWLTEFISERVLRIRYEDLCDEPHDLLERVQRWIGIEPSPLNLEPPRDLHWLGNSTLFEFGGKIRRDERWREELTGPELEMIHRLTGKMAERYGYGLSRSW